MLYNPGYLEKFKPLFSDKHIENRAKVEAVNLLMWATGVYKLFTKEDYREFFKRMHLISKHFNLIDRFFLNESDLLSFIYKGQVYAIGMEDFANCIGLMCGTSPRTMEPFDEWLKDIQYRFNETILTGLDNQLIIFIGDIQINDVIVNGKVGQELQFKNRVRELDKDDIINSDVLANSMVDEIMEAVFVNWKSKHPDAEEKYNKQAVELQNIPHFEFWKLPGNKTEEILSHFRGYFEPENLDIRLAMLLTHLAWAWKNDFVFLGEHGNYELVNYVWLDTEKLEWNGPGYNLEELKDSFNLEAIYELLE